MIITRDELLAAKADFEQTNSSNWSAYQFEESTEALIRKLLDLHLDGNVVVVPVEPDNQQLINGIGEYNFWNDWSDKSDSAIMINKVYRSMIKPHLAETEKTAAEKGE